MTGDESERTDDRAVQEAGDRAGLRASDADRARVAERLGTAHAEGRLTLADYDERLRDAYAATTYGDLQRLTADLPAVVPGTSPAEIAAEEEALRRAVRTERSNEWRSWLGMSLVLFTIWGITCLAAGAVIFPWPLFPVGIWAAFLVAGLIDREDQEKRLQKARKKLAKERRRELGEGH